MPQQWSEPAGPYLGTQIPVGDLGTGPSWAQAERALAPVRECLALLAPSVPQTPVYVERIGLVPRNSTSHYFQQDV